MMLARLAISEVLLAAGAATLGAQSRRPSFAAEVALGGGSGRGGEYRDRGQWTRRVGAMAVLPLRANLALTVGADLETVEHIGDYIDLCVIASDGECIPEFPGFAGWTGAVGLQYTPTDGFIVGARVGAGRYHTPKRDVRDRPREHAAALAFRQVLAVRAVGPVWLVGSVSVVRVAPIGGDALGARTITVGVRVN